MQKCVFQKLSQAAYFPILEGFIAVVWKQCPQHDSTKMYQNQTRKMWSMARYGTLCVFFLETDPKWTTARIPVNILCEHKMLLKEWDTK